MAATTDTILHHSATRKRHDSVGKSSMKHGPKRFQLLSTMEYCDDHGKHDFDTNDGTMEIQIATAPSSDSVDVTGSHTDDISRRFDCVARSSPRDNTPDDNTTEDDTSKDDTSEVDMSADDTSGDPNEATNRGIIGRVRPHQWPC